MRKNQKARKIVTVKFFLLFDISLSDVVDLVPPSLEWLGGIFYFLTYIMFSNYNIFPTFAIEENKNG